MSELIFLEPIFKKTVWGGDKLKRVYGFDTPGGTGECWLVSAHPAGDCFVASGKYAGMKLSRLRREHGELFGGEGDFPLLIKLIDAKSDLSVQVHPDDGYALAHENSRGKTECWYVLDAEEGAELVLGHNAADREELIKMAGEGRWEELLRRTPVKKGDFFQLEPGTIHALCGGVTVLETQQSSDITYRLYDYGRLENGRPRQLHLEKGLEVVNCPYVPPEDEREVAADGDCRREILVTCEFYTVEKITVDGSAALEWPSYAALAVICGGGTADGNPVRAGSAFIVPDGHGKTRLEGRLTLIAARPAELYLGVDLGGTNIAAGLVDEKGRILRRASVPTLAHRPIGEIVDGMASLCRSVAGASYAAVKAVGVGCPGTVDHRSGTVRYSNNIPMKDVPMAEMLEERLGRPVALENDANAAALGEWTVSGGNSLVLITLGTGVGGGAVLDGRLYRGFNGAGFEPGHMLADPDGPACTCGNRGCWESLASATALVRQTAEAMETDGGSLMHEWVKNNGLDGRTAFACAALGDAAAIKVRDGYIRHVGRGLASLLNLLQPEVIAVGGGISNEGESFIAPLRDFVYALDFNKYCKKTLIRAARLRDGAGIVGAAVSAKNKYGEKRRENYD